jgi:branched-chain amino acid transport system substrate-binding protein
VTTTRRAAVLTVLTALLGLIALAPLGAAPAAAQETIKVGLIDPLTGGSSFYGQSLLRGAQLAIDEANAKGGVLGKKIELVVEDDRSVPADGTSAAIKLITRDNVVAILGTFNSSVSLAVGDVARRYGVPQIITSAVADSITEKNDPAKPWVFRASSRSSDQAVAIVGYLVDVAKVKNTVLLEDATDFGTSCGGEVKKDAERRGLKILGTERFNPGETNFYSVLTKVRAMTPESVVICGLITEGAQILRQAQDLGLKAVFIGNTAFNNDKLLELAKDAAEGMVANATYEATSKRAAAREFTEKYRAKFNEFPQYTAAQGYDAALALIDAIKRAGGPDREKVRAALASTKNLSRVESGPLTFDPKGQAKDFKFSYVQFKGGKRILVYEPD